MMKHYFLAVLLTCSTSLFAAIDAYEFSQDDHRLLFQQLSEELRCPKCQNQNLADSNSAIAKDLKNELYRMVTDGQSTEQIKGFMVERYGQFVLYKPEVNSLTYLLWYGPFALLALGCLVVLVLARSKRAGQQPAKAEPDGAARIEQPEGHQQRLKELLDKKK